MHQRTSAPQRLSALRVAQRLTPLAALLAALASSSPAQGQVAETSTYRLPSHSGSLAGTDDSSTLAKNPANLGFMSGAELRYSGALLPGGEEASRFLSGHALAFATQLPLGLASGARVDLVDDEPTVTWGLAMAPLESLSFGLSLQYIDPSGKVLRSSDVMRGEATESSTSDPGGIATLTLGATARPSKFVSLALVLHGLTLSERNHDTGYINLGVTTFPLGHRGVELGAELLWVNGPMGHYSKRPESRPVPRVNLGVALSDMVKLFGSMSYFWGDEAILAVGLSFTPPIPPIPQGSAELAGGAMLPGPIYFTDVAVRGFGAPPKAEEQAKPAGTPDTDEAPQPEAEL